MTIQREYIVTLKNKNDLNSFYLDMETEGGDQYIPNRKVDLTERRPLSKNTHYNLTAEEVEKLQLDSRVHSIELSPDEQGIIIIPLNYLTEQSSNFWFKSRITTNQHLNWGLLRCYEGSQVPNWGTDGVQNVFGQIKLTNIGRNVDVVVVDGIIDPVHPEFAVNPDGSGGSRIIQYNWYQHNPTVRGTAASSYPYNDILNDASEIGNNDHGYHVAGTVTGNTQGWARAANIYNISPYRSIDSNYIIDYIREFHRSKAVNPITGVKNPTIINMSYTSVAQNTISNISSIQFRNQVYPQPAGGWTSNLLNSYGLNPISNIFTPSKTTILHVVRSNAIDVELNDAMNEGIICLGAAGNDGMHCSLPNDIDYDNAYVARGYLYYYHRGPSQGGAPRVICVGSVDSTKNERKANYSNTGPRIDLYAPGTDIMSAYKSYSVQDSRNFNYNLAKISGTSMATPQVCGILASVLEIFPNMSQDDAMAYVKLYASKNDLLDAPFNNFTDLVSLRDANNFYSKVRLERKLSGVVHPKLDFYQFKASQPIGEHIVYPRPRIRRRG